MAVNLASKYASKVAERFHQQSLTAGAFSNDYEFTGVKTVKIYSVGTVALGDYTRTGSARYGSPTELQDTVQELIMTQDKSFTFTIDKGNDAEQVNVKGAAKALRRQIDEQVVPHIDKYRFQVWATDAGKVAELGDAPTASTIVGHILDAGAWLDDKLVPQSGRTLFLPANMYRLLKENPDFISIDKLGESALAKGKVGELDGMAVVKVPSSWMPDGVYFLVVQKSACLSPVKLQDYKVHKDPPGISGSLVEGRILFDAFVLDAKADGIYACAAEA